MVKRREKKRKAIEGEGVRRGKFNNTVKGNNIEWITLRKGLRRKGE